MRPMLTFSTALVLAGAFALAMWLHLPWDAVITTGLVILCLVWLGVVLTLPWNVYFQAKAVLFEMQRARERDIAVRPDRELEALSVQRRMLRFSVALHVGSALVAAGIATISHARWGYLFSAAYLVSSLFRPGVEYYGYLRKRLGHLVAEVTFPRQDVTVLLADVKRLREDADRSLKTEEVLRERITQVEQAAEQRHQALEKRFVSLARTFEETVNRLTDNQQIIGGIKALLRLIQVGGEANPMP